MLSDFVKDLGYLIPSIQRKHTVSFCVYSKIRFFSFQVFSQVIWRPAGISTRYFFLRQLLLAIIERILQSKELGEQFGP
jgi:hypothetical protein